jgi:hypothetical protein
LPRRIATNGVPLALSLLTEGASNASLEAHRLRQMLHRALILVESSNQREHLYEVAGDIIVEFPRHLQQLERHLNRLQYALAALGRNQLRDRIPLSDRYTVEYALQDAMFPIVSDEGQSPFPPKKPVDAMAQRVARRYQNRQADLNPPLGVPGGPCHAMQRINLRVRDPKLRKGLIEKVEEGYDLDNREAVKVYALEEREGGVEGTPFRSMVLTAHVQFRMDQRAISVADLKAAFLKFQEEYGKEKSRNSPVWQRWESDLDRGEAIRWDSPTGLTVVFTTRSVGTDPKGRKLRQATLVTTYWRNKADPRPVPVEACPNL